jgi:hypothetical protein
MQRFSHSSRVLTQPATFVTWTGVGVCVRVPVNINQHQLTPEAVEELHYTQARGVYIVLLRPPPRRIFFLISSTSNLRQALNQLLV